MRQNSTLQPQKTELVKRVAQLMKGKMDLSNLLCQVSSQDLERYLINTRYIGVLKPNPLDSWLAKVDLLLLIFLFIFLWRFTNFVGEGPKSRQDHGLLFEIVAYWILAYKYGHLSTFYLLFYFHRDRPNGRTFDKQADHVFQLLAAVIEKEEVKVSHIKTGVH